MAADGYQDCLMVLAERVQIARELHAGTIRLLFWLGFELEATARQAREARVAERLESCVGELDEGIAEPRRLAFDLNAVDD
jgi:signal transduction histidine kinase